MNYPMKSVEISSAQNGRFKKTRDLLTSKKVRQKTSCFLIEGLRAISSLTENQGGFIIQEFWANLAERENPELIQLTEGATVYLVPESMFRQLTDTVTSQGLVAVVEHTPIPLQINKDAGKYILLDSVRDPGNLGTIIRTAVGAGFDGIFLYGNCTELFNPKVLRSTMGMLPFMPVWPVENSIFSQLSDNKYDLVTTVVDAGDNIFKKKFSKKTVLVIGSEAHGVSAQVLQHATVKVTIPTSERCESLNAAIAAGVCMFQVAANNE